MTSELWKPIPNIPGYYASSLGRIKDENDSVINQHENSGYLEVSLKSCGVHRVHRLICSAFHDNPENKSEVNHIDGNKQNNAADNLEWVTHQENMLHAFRTGLQTFDKETRKKISEAKKGKQLSEEHRMNIGESHRGKHHSDETRKKMSEARKLYYQKLKSA